MENKRILYRTVDGDGITRFHKFGNTHFTEYMLSKNNDTMYDLKTKKAKAKFLLRATFYRFFKAENPWIRNVVYTVLSFVVIGAMLWAVLFPSNNKQPETINNDNIEYSNTYSYIDEMNEYGTGRYYSLEDYEALVTETGINK